MTGYGLEDGVQMGPVITPESKQRVEGLIAEGIHEGAKALVDGRKAQIRGYEEGNFVRPTLLSVSRRTPAGGWRCDALFVRSQRPGTATPTGRFAASVAAF